MNYVPSKSSFPSQSLQIDRLSCQEATRAVFKDPNSSIRFNNYVIDFSRPPALGVSINNISRKQTQD